MISKVSKLKQKSNCVVVIVEASSSFRQMISETLKEVGFHRIMGASSPKDCLRMLEVEPVDWIVSSIFPNETINALSLLKLCTVHPDLRRTRMTFFADQANEDDTLTYAFELGLISAHEKPNQRDEFKGIFSQLIDLFEMYEWDETLVSAEYLRQFLARKKYFAEQLALEEKLLALYPGRPQVLLHLADAELSNGNHQKGLGVLDQLELIDEVLAKKCRVVRQKHSQSTTQSSEGPRKNIFDIHNAVVVDPDTDVLFHVKDLLEKSGAEGVETFESGSKAFEWLSSNGKEPGLVVIEWKIPGITGAMLIQRVRSLGFHNTPILVFSSLVKSSDIHVLREMGVSDCHEKPFDQYAFFRSVMATIQQNRHPSNERSMKIKIKSLLNSKKISAAKKLIKQFVQDPSASETVRKEIQAEYHLAKGEYESARDAGISAIKSGGDSLTMLNVVGKAMLKLRQFEYALKCFDRANSISALNIERLINMAEASIELDKPTDAQQTVAQAKSLDVDNPDVKKMDCKVSIEVGKSELAKSLMNDLNSGKDIISYMNNRAVALIKAGRFNDGVGLYQKTYDSIPDNWKEQQAAVRYNMGLAYAKSGDLDKAFGLLETILTTGKDTAIFKRAKSLASRIQDCRSNNTSLTLASSDEASSEVAISTPGTGSSTGSDSGGDDPFAEQETPTPPEIQPGEIACHLVYFRSNQATSKLLDNVPNFKPRRNPQQPAK